MPHVPYTDEQKEGLKRWIAQWRITGPLLEEQREADIRAADTVRDVHALAGIAEHANRTMPLRESSGLIEMQRIFLRGVKGRPR